MNQEHEKKKAEKQVIAEVESKKKEEKDHVKEVKKCERE